MAELVENLSQRLRDKGWMMVTAESCTGGMIASAMTDLAGSSDVFERGFVTYSNAAKQEILYVPGNIIETHGAVSEQTAKAMVEGALKAVPQAHLAVAVTGIAGPGGGSAEKPVGLVYIGYGIRENVAQVSKHVFDGDRAAIRQQTVEAALQHCLDLVSSP